MTDRNTIDVFTAGIMMLLGLSSIAFALWGKPWRGEP